MSESLTFSQRLRVYAATSSGGVVTPAEKARQLARMLEQQQKADVMAANHLAQRVQHERFERRMTTVWMWSLTLLTAINLAVFLREVLGW